MNKEQARLMQPGSAGKLHVKLLISLRLSNSIFLNITVRANGVRNACVKSVKMKIQRPANFPHGILTHISLDSNPMSVLLLHTR